MRAYEARRGWCELGVVATLAGTLAVSGCGGDDKAKAPAPSSTELCTDLPRTSVVLPRLTFNSLRGGSPAIYVYPGTEDNNADNQPTGYYCNGDKAPVKCHEVGRLVVSHPENGEIERKSTDWYLLDTGTTEYATATYADIEAGEQPIKECSSVTVEE